MDRIDNLLAKSNGETIRQHTDNLIKAFDEFKCLYGYLFDDKTLKAIEYACEYHDYGKASLLFQKMLGNNKELCDTKNYKGILQVYINNGFNKNIPHGYLSPAFLSFDELEKDIGSSLARCVYNAVFYHHNREIDINARQLEEIILSDFKSRFNIQSFSYKQYLFNSTAITDEQWIQYAVILGMLNKFDYYASNIQEKFPVEIDGKYEDKYVGNYVIENFKEKGFGLRDVQQYMLDNKNSNLIVVASTGIGKTEAALLWAGEQKLFYTLPLKVSINAMYKRLISSYGYTKDKVTLLHSDFISQLSATESNSELLLKCDASKRLSYPYTVCTIDQLFSFVYKYRGCEILLATLKYSKVVIDEIQSYEPKLIAKLIYGLKLITDAGGKFAIITATMPDILLHFIKREKIPCLSPQKFLINIMRHKISYEKADDFDYDKIVQNGTDKKVLVICNTVKKACSVYAKLKEEYACPNVSLLHANFIRKHRNILEDEILKFAEDKNSVGIWVTTQLVEASLDIDFDILFTEMCTADSLLQRMGRCYRKREYKDNLPNVIIVDTQNGYGKVYKYVEIYDRSVNYLQKYNNSFFSENEKMDYINAVYNTQELKRYSNKNGQGYYNDIFKTISQLKKLCAFNFSKNEAKKKMREIISYKVIPEQIYNQNLDELTQAYHILIDKKNHSFFERQNAKQLIEDNSINLGNYDFRIREKSNSLFEGLDYYTINYMYEFDEQTLTGKGLEYYKDEDDNFL